MFLDGIKQAIGSVFHKLPDFVHEHLEHLPSLPVDSLSLSNEAREILDGDVPSGAMAAAIPGQESGGFKPFMLTQNRSGRGRGPLPASDSVLA